MRRSRACPVVLAVFTAAFSLVAAPAAAVTIGGDPQPTWQTVGSLDARGRNLQGRVNDVVYGSRASAGRVFLGGEFTKMRPPAGGSGNPVTRLHLASLSVRRGKPIGTWKVPVRASSPGVQARIVTMTLSRDGKVLYVGGRFESIGGKPRSNVAALNASTGRVLRWHPRPNGGVHAIALGRGNGLVYLGGTFSSVNGTVRQHLAAVRRTGGALVGGWNASAVQVSGSCPPRCAADVEALMLSGDGDTLYIGGSFARVDASRRNSAAAVKADSGRLLRWNPSVYDAGPNGSLNVVSDLERIGKRIVLCGDFSQINYGRSPLVSPNLAAVDRRRGNAITRFNASTDGAVNACAYHGKAKLLFIGGHFDHAGRRTAVRRNTAPTRHHMAAVAGRTGALNAWAPDANSVPGAFGVGVQKTHVGFGGDFTTVNGSAQAGFAQFRVSL